MKKLSEVLNKEYLYGEAGRRISVLAESGAEVVREHSCFVGDENYAPWKGTQKYVSYWYALDNGDSVGFNENVKSGFSYVLKPAERTKKLSGCG